MSRTNRRKNDRWLEAECVDDWYTNNEHETWIGEISTDVAPKKRKANFHSDKMKNIHAPKEYRKDKNKTLRCQNKAILKNAVNDKNEPNFVPFIKNADWEYF